MPTRQLTHFRNIGDIFWREVFFNIPRGFRVPGFLVAQSYIRLGNVECQQPSDGQKWREQLRST